MSKSAKPEEIVKKLLVACDKEEFRHVAVENSFRKVTHDFTWKNTADKICTII